ncbi:MAG: hypothetical protein R3F11_13040 [Verrucomicrobiales bacterium]
MPSNRPRSSPSALPATAQNAAQASLPLSGQVSAKPIMEGEMIRLQGTVDFAAVTPQANLNHWTKPTLNTWGFITPESLVPQIPTGIDFDAPLAPGQTPLVVADLPNGKKALVMLTPSLLANDDAE